MKKIKVIIWAVTMLFVVTACNDDETETVAETISAADREFVLNALDGGMFEVKAGELALAKGDTSTMMVDSILTSIQSFGQMMATDHAKVNQELENLADRKQVATTTTLSVAKQQRIDSLSAAQGAVFDSLYIQMMVVSHQEAVGLFEAQSINGDDNDLKSWAADQLPTLKHHLEFAKVMRDSLQ
jgi:putative membrane protein